MDAIVAYTLKKGTPQTATIPATAGNVEYYLSPGSGYAIKIEYLRVTLTTDITVANRYIRFSVRTSAGGTAYIHRLLTSAVIVASTAAATDVGPECYSSSGALIDNSYLGINELWIYDTDRFYIDIAGGVAGDSYSGYIKYLLVKR